MNLAEYKSPGPIFVDANIFIDHGLPNPRHIDIIAEFLDEIETSEIKAVTSTAVLNEVSYILIIFKASIILQTNKRYKIREMIKKDQGIASQCYNTVKEFNEYLSTLNGLEVVPVTYEDYLQASDLGNAYRLLPGDALHLSIMKNNSIADIATTDSDFRRVDGIEIWSP